MPGLSAREGPVLLVGCGRMGGAFTSGWLEQGVAAAEIVVVEPDERAAEIARERGVTVVAGQNSLASQFTPAIVVFAVKPQAMDEVAPAFARYAGRGSVFLSIAAGKTIAYFERHLGTGAAIVRAMPNTPAQVGRGISVACANPNVSEAQRRGCGELLAAVGELAWIDDEALMDAVTAASGSGPAYVFLLIECLAQAGVEAGLSEDLAMRLARATVCGAGELAYRSDEPAGVLRRNVTSPGGTTEAALGVLMAEDGLERLITRAVLAAARRSRELAG